MTSGPSGAGIGGSMALSSFLRSKPWMLFIFIQAGYILFRCFYITGNSTKNTVLLDYEADYAITPEVRGNATNGNATSHSINVQYPSHMIENTNSTSGVQPTHSYKDWKSSYMYSASLSKKQQEAKHYLELYEEQCASVNNTIGRLESDGRFALCPCVSPLLKGKLHPSQRISFRPWSDIVSEVGREVGSGGYYKPGNCLARLRVAIVIPFRDREIHLRALMSHLHPILQRQLLEYRIFVVEQNYPVIFNKASMMNIGYLEAGKLWPDHDCIVFHDVDMLMEDDRNLFYCGGRPLHMGCYTDKFRYKLLYATIFGGVLSFTRAQFLRVNGYSNSYFGWGGEDDDMYNRISSSDLGFVRPPPSLARYIQLKHKRDTSNPDNLNAVETGAWRSQPEVYKVDGVKQVRYKIVQLKNEPLYTWMHVDLDISNLNYTLKANVVLYNYSSEIGDCPGHDVTSKPVSLVSCRFACDTHRQCTGFVYCPGRQIPCFLKQGTCSEISKKIPGATYYQKLPPLSSASQNASIKKYTYTPKSGDCPGSDIGDGLVVSREECEERCDEDDLCVAYQYSLNKEKHCWLKNRCTHIANISGLTVYIKETQMSNPT